MRKLLIILCIVLLWVPVSWAGTPYYVDCSLSTGDNDGTSPANAWQTIAAAIHITTGFNSKAEGDDLYFAVDSTCTFSQASDTIILTNGGSSGDHAVIGAYEASGDFVMEGDETLPIIDGDFVSGAGYGLYLNGAGYWDVRDIEITEIDGYGIYVGSQSYNVGVDIDSVKISKTVSSGIQLQKVANGATVTDCDVSRHNLKAERYCSTVNPTSTGCAVSLTTGTHYSGEDWQAGIAQAYSLGSGSVVISGNKVYQGYGEGIGLYYSADNAVVEYNVVWDNQKGQIYAEKSHTNIIRHNLVYNTDDEIYYREISGVGWRPSRGIGEDTEQSGTTGWRLSDITNGDQVTYDNVFYGNVVVHCYIGLFFLTTWEDNAACSSGAPPTPYPCCTGVGTGTCYSKSNAQFYNNTVVDSIYGISWGPPSDGAIVKNNIISCQDATGGAGDDVGDCTMTTDNNWDGSGITWDYQMWHRKTSMIEDKLDARLTDVEDTDAEFAGAATYDFTALTSGGLDISAFGPALTQGAVESATAPPGNPVVVTITGHSFSDNDVVSISGMVEMTEANYNSYTVASADANTFALSGTDGDNFTAETGVGGTITRATAPWIDTGVDLGSPYTTLIDPFESTFTSSPISITTLIQSEDYGDPEIGAAIYAAPESEPPQTQPGGNDFSGTGDIEALWHFDSGALGTDDKGAYTLTETNTPGTETSAMLQGDGAVDLNGTDEYMTRTGAANDFGWNDTKDFTITGFIKADTSDNNAVIFAKADVNEKCLEIDYMATGVLRVRFGHTGGTLYENEQSSQTMTDGDIYFFAVSYDGDAASREGQIYLYNMTTSSLLEKRAISTAATWDGQDEEGDLFVGITFGASADDAFDGWIDHMTVWQVELSDEDIILIRDQLYGAQGGAAPTVTDIGIITGGDTFVTAPATTYNTIGETIKFALEISEQVTVTNTPTLGIIVNPGATTYQIDYSGWIDLAGTYYLTFDYTGIAGHKSPDLQTDAVGDALVLGDGVTIQDGDVNDLVVTLPSTDFGSIIFDYQASPTGKSGAGTAGSFSMGP